LLSCCINQAVTSGASQAQMPRKLTQTVTMCTLLPPIANEKYPLYDVLCCNAETGFCFICQATLFLSGDTYIANRSYRSLTQRQ
jgi:hypothetical protein